MMHRFGAIAVVAFSAASAVPTLAPAQDTRSARVLYIDLDLATAAGQQKLQRRIILAARSVCDTNDVPDPAMMQIVSNCRRIAVASAQPSFDAAVAMARQPNAVVLEGTAVIVTAP